MKIVHLLRKPLSEPTIAANVLRWGTSALNIDATRIAFTDNVNMDAQQRQQNSEGVIGGAFGAASLIGKVIPTYKPGGRWPANLVLQHLDGCVQEGVKKVPGHKGYPNGPKGKSTHYSSDARSVEVRPNPWVGHADPDGTETVAAWVCAEGCPVAGLDSQSGVSKTPTTVTRGAGGRNGRYGPTGAQGEIPSYGDTGGASRFFKQVLSDDALLDYLRALTVPLDGVFVATAEGEPWDQGAATVHAVILVGEAERDIGEAFRVLRPGGHLMLIGSDGVGFRGACAAEDAGFEVRDAIFVADDPGDLLHYVAKASTSERERGLTRAEGGKRANTHPTVKPIRVMERLLRQVDPGDLVVDPFLGSGTTGLAAKQTGHTFVGIEREGEYVQIALARLQGP